MVKNKADANMSKYEEQEPYQKDVETANTKKEKILKCAWNLFYDKGYIETTVNDIISAANISKGGFYHHFKAKEDLLESLVEIFDNKYKMFAEEMNEEINSYQKLLMLHSYSFYFMEQNVSIDLFRALYAVPLKHQKNNMFWTKERFYWQLVYKYVTEGQKRGQIDDAVSAEYIVKNYIMLERGLCYDWCISNERYSLAYQGVDVFNRFFSCFEKK